MPASPSATAASDIALWGPSGSGKTWLVHAFHRELKWYSQRDPEFSYRLTDQEDNPIHTRPLTGESVPATEAPEDYLWRFHREPKRDTPAHRISAHTHDVSVHDDKGAHLTEIIESPGAHALTQATLESSPYVVALLDYTLIKNPGAAVDLLANPLYSLNDYADLLQGLCAMLTNPNIPSRERFLAVCVSKVDIWDLRRPPWQLIEAFFKPVYDLLHEYQYRITTEAFAASAVGFYWHKGKRCANLRPGSHELLWPDRWEPHGVAGPFFWLFENNERQRLLANKNPLADPLRDYLPYPPIRL